MVDMPRGCGSGEYVVLVCGPDIIANTNLSTASALLAWAAHQLKSVNVRLSPFESVKCAAPDTHAHSERFSVLGGSGYRSYLRLRVISWARRSRGQEASTPLSPKPPLFNYQRIKEVCRYGQMRKSIWFGSFHGNPPQEFPEGDRGKRSGGSSF